MHIFSTHLQASYLDSDLVTYVDTYIARYEQIKEIKQEAKKLFDSKDSSKFDRENDIVMIVGDFNQNAASMNKA